MASAAPGTRETVRADMRIAPIVFTALVACGGSPTTPPPEAEDEGSEVAAAPAPEPSAETEAEPTEAESEPEPEPTEAADASGITPLTDAQRAILAGLPRETIPLPGEYYYRSNELRHDLLADDLRGRGGAVVGVGPDQLYTLAALSGAELIVGTDYDARVPALHRLYGVLVPRSETADDLIERFSEAKEAETLALLRAELEPGDAQPIRMFERLRQDLHEYLQRQHAREHRAAPTTWMADPAYYAHVRDLFRAGRVVARTGDLTGTTTVRAVGAALRELGIPVRIFYMSNADQFFRYTDDFIANVEALPTDERTIVVRSIRNPELPNALRDRWHYIVQEHADFIERLKLRYFRRSQVIVQELIDAGPPWVGEGVSHITRETPRPLLEHRQRRQRRGQASE